MLSKEKIDEMESDIEEAGEIAKKIGRHFCSNDKINFTALSLALAALISDFPDTNRIALLACHISLVKKMINAIGDEQVNQKTTTTPGEDVVH